MYRIVTHPGSAHKDDFLSACVLLATLDHAEVYRREPTDADLNDIDTYVVDVGLEYNPQRHNFDHHQDKSLPCAFHLIMEHLGHHDSATLMFAWYPHMSMIDVRGPYRTAEHLGIDTNILFAATSPIDGYILSQFAGASCFSEGDVFHALMKSLGENLIAMIDQKMQRLERLKREVQVVPVQHLKAVTSEIEDSPKLSMELLLKYLDDELIVMSITPSNRGDGWELLRLGDNSVVDFRLLEGNEAIRFVHGNGFLAKTHTRMPLSEALELASKAVKL